jgi:hypothetical protein
MFLRFLKNSERKKWLWMGAIVFTMGCSNLPFVKQTKAPTQIYLTDFSTAWTATLEAVSAGKDLVKSQNRETGIIESQWIDNSESRQFLDVFSDEDFFLRMRFRLRIQVREGKKNDQQAVMIRVIKQQQKESTLLGGFQDVETDGLEEGVYLYRIGRLIAIQQHNDNKDDRNKAIVDDDDTILF